MILPMTGRDRRRSEHCGGSMAAGCRPPSGARGSAPFGPRRASSHRENGHVRRVAKRYRPRSTYGAAIAPSRVASGKRHAATGSVSPAGPDLSWCTLQVTLQLGQSVRKGVQASPRTTARGVQRPCTSRSRRWQVSALVSPACHAARRAMLPPAGLHHTTGAFCLVGRALGGAGTGNRTPDLLITSSQLVAGKSDGEYVG